MEMDTRIGFEDHLAESRYIHVPSTETAAKIISNYVRFTWWEWNAINFVVGVWKCFAIRNCFEAKRNMHAHVMEKISFECMKAFSFLLYSVISQWTACYAINVANAWAGANSFSLYSLIRKTRYLKRNDTVCKIWQKIHDRKYMGIWTTNSYVKWSLDSEYVVEKKMIRDISWSNPEKPREKPILLGFPNFEFLCPWRRRGPHNENEVGVQWWLCENVYFDD